MNKDNNTLLLTTLFSGYNYGSSLQAFASKLIIEELGYKCKLVARKSLIKGRDVRLGKLFVILLRTILRFDLNTLKTYRSSYQMDLIGDSADRFLSFEQTFLKPYRMSWRALCNESRQSLACIAGSDQLWDPTSLYVDPVYYLRFAPLKKRISFSTSLGHNSIPDYNKRILKAWISDFRFLSVREDSGVRLIKDLCGRDAVHLLDPSLLIDGNTWREKFQIKNNAEKYILAYFLDSPSKKALQCISYLRSMCQCEVIGVPYEHEDMEYASKIIPSGPLDFLNLIENAVAVVTDSFHGTAFSINLHTPFYVFERNYGVAHSQSSRVVSLLKKLNLLERYEFQDSSYSLDVDFKESDSILNTERKKAREYLSNAIASCKK